MCLWYSFPRASSLGYLEGVGFRRRSDPPLNIDGVAAVRGEDAPAVPLLPSLVAWPSSRRGTPPAILPPNIDGVAIVRGEDAPPVLSAEPWLVAIFGEGDAAGDTPPNICGWRSSGGRMRLRSSSHRASSRGHLQEGGCRRQSSPQILQRGGRPGGGCASGPLPAEPRCVAIFREGNAAGDPPPKKQRRGRPEGRPEGGRASAPPPAEPRHVAILREEDVAGNPPPQYLRRGGRPGGGCISGPPPAEPRRVAIFWEGDADRSAAGCASGTPPAEPRPVAIPREGDANGDPPAEPLRAAVVWGEDAQLAFLLPNLVT